MEQYQINDLLINMAIFGDCRCKHPRVERGNGYINNDLKEYGRCILEYIASCYFGIHRFPGFEPYYQHDNARFLKNFMELTELDISEAITEFDKIYKHVQMSLSKSPRVINGKVKLNRALRDFEIKEVVPQLIAGKKEIRMPANILTSYAHDGNLKSYNTWLHILRDVEVEKVFFYDNYILDPDGKCENGVHGGESEVWVLNDDIFGEIVLDRECFSFDEIPKDEITRAEKYEVQNHFKPEIITDGRISNYGELSPRPCEWDWITKKIIERNKRKIDELYTF